MNRSSFLSIAMTVTLSILAALGPTSAAGSSSNAEDFPFQKQSFRVRFQPGFFKAGSDLFDDILRSTGLVDSTNTLKIVRDGLTNFVQYRSLKTSLRMEQNRLIGTIEIDIIKGELFAKQIKGCSVLLNGMLAFSTVLEIKPSGAINVDIPTELYKASALQTQKKNCGFFADIFAGPEYVRTMLKDGLEEELGKVINEQEFKFVADPKVDELLQASRIYLNLPSETVLDPRKSRSNFDIAVGVRGALAGAQSPAHGLRIVNAQRSHLSGLGLEWLLGAGIVAKSQNINDKAFRAKIPTGGTDWPEWGLAPYKKLGAPIAFDAGVMLRGSFLKSIFSALYQAGFFNIQIQDSIVDKKLIALNPMAWDEIFGITLPNGTALSKENYQDLKIETVMATAPAVSIRDTKSIDLLVPDLTLKISAKAKGTEMFEVLSFRARFHILTTPEMDDDGRLRLRFNDKPIEAFELLSRDGVSPGISNDQVEARVNQALVEILRQAKVEIPLLKGKKVTIPYMAIDGDRDAGTEALAVYLKIK